MNRLWVRLSFAFSAVVFTSLATIALVSVIVIRANSAEFAHLSDNADASFAIPAIAPQNGEATLAAPTTTAADSTTATPPSHLIPVEVDGSTVAYIDMSCLFQPPPRPSPLVSWEGIVLIVAGVSIVISILFGVLMSRSLTKPLNGLAVTADAIGAGKWDQRVLVKGTTEIASLAQSFNKMVDQLQRNELLRRNLVADVAHELRTRPRSNGPSVQSGGDRPTIAAIEPRTIAFPSSYPVGSIVIDTKGRQLFLIKSATEALHYPISVGREGFSWTGTETISRKAEWPDWYPPQEMRYRDWRLPEKMTGGIKNPLGATALYLGNSLYRIHGTNDPKSIGRAASSGCFRMLNGHIIDLASRVDVGTPVTVVHRLPPELEKVVAEQLPSLKPVATKGAGRS